MESILVNLGQAGKLTPYITPARSTQALGLALAFLTAIQSMEIRIQAHQLLTNQHLNHQKSLPMTEM